MRLSGFLALLVSIVAALCACLGGLAPAASAVGTYTVNICNGMNDPPPIGSLTDRPKNLASEVNCPQGRLALATVIEPVHVEVDGTVGWRFNAPPDTAITLKPRGYHLLFQELKKPLALGERVPVTLTFEKAGTRQIELLVEAPGPVGNETLYEGQSG